MSLTHPDNYYIKQQKENIRMIDDTKPHRNENERFRRLRSVINHAMRLGGFIWVDKEQEIKVRGLDSGSTYVLKPKGEV